ncbi:MAG: hypothetical protein DRO88_04380 [Promethearchaeia archaeon]|nr:MAG: hypothetical protein DRO88_04380 [Candidatus Lokiarchaeia archaeon]
MSKNKKSLYGNKYVNIENGELKLGNILCKNLTQNWETPIFLFLEQKIRDNIRYITSVFKEVFPKSRGFYSMKANFLQKTMEIIRDEQFGAEIVSFNELKILEKLNFDSSRIIVGGPYLSAQLLDKIISMEIPYIVIYDIDEIPKISQRIRQNNKSNKYKPKILLKFQTLKYTSRHGLSHTKDTFQTLSKIFIANPELEYAGILSHYGTRLKTWIQYEQNLNNLIEIVQKIKNFAGLETKILDIGGGFSNADSLKEKEFRSYLERMREMLRKENLQNCTIFYEPGRFIMEDTGFCISQVIRVDPHHRVVFLNIGNNFIPKFMKSSLRFYNADRITESPNTPMDFMGYIPSDQDILIKKYNFTQSVQKGDIIVIANVGAYALTWSTRFPYQIPKILFLGKKNIVRYQGDPNPAEFSLS